MSEDARFYLTGYLIGVALFTWLCSRALEWELWQSRWPDRLQTIGFIALVSLTWPVSLPTMAIWETVTGLRRRKRR